MTKPAEKRGTGARSVETAIDLPEVERSGSERAWAMKRSLRIRVVPAMVAAVLGMLWITPWAYAADEVSVSDLEVVARSLGFLERPQRDDGIAVAIVYAPDQPAAAVQAQEAAARLGAIPGPNGARFRPMVISTDALDQIQDGLDVIFLMPGAAKYPDAILGAMRHRHLASISNDPACLDENCCVLFVRTGHRVEIVLDAALAKTVDARFSAVFTIMVKRK